MIRQTCTCIGFCKGAAGLANGWRCALEVPTIEEAQAAYESSEPVELSDERIDEIVRYAIQPSPAAKGVT